VTGRIIGVGLALALVAVRGSANAACSKDSDCKGDRICSDDGKCVAPDDVTTKPKSKPAEKRATKPDDDADDRAVTSKPRKPRARRDDDEDDQPRAFKRHAGESVTPYAGWSSAGLIGWAAPLGGGANYYGFTSGGMVGWSSGTWAYVGLRAVDHIGKDLGAGSVHASASQVTLELGYEEPIGDLLLRPSVEIGLSIRKVAGDDPFFGPVSESKTYLVVNLGVSMLYPRKGLFYVGADVRLSSYPTESTDGWWFGGLATVGIRWNEL
jgi:hypothetical protein